MNPKLITTNIKISPIVTRHFYFVTSLFTYKLNNIMLIVPKVCPPKNIIPSEVPYAIGKAT